MSLLHPQLSHHSSATPKYAVCYCYALASYMMYISKHTLSHAEAILSLLIRSTPLARRSPRWAGQRCSYQVQAGAIPVLSSHLTPTFFHSGRCDNANEGGSFVSRSLQARSPAILRSSDLWELQYSEQPPEPPRPHNTPHISDHEYQTRVGKACRVLMETLPDFMSRGIVDLDDLASTPCTSEKPNIMHRLSPLFNHNTIKRAIWGSQFQPNSLQAASFDSLYHPSIAFEFRPPIPNLGLGKGSDGSDDTQLASDGSANLSDTENNSSSPQRGGPTIYFNGRTVYTTSAHILRHALSALFYDTTLHLDSARFEGRSRSSGAWSDVSSYLRRQSSAPEPEGKPSSSGPDRLVVRIRFEGISRVTLQPHTYTVIFKYDFDRQSGMIARHLVDNIQPVPGSKVWAGLTNVWGTLSPAGPSGGGAAHYKGLIPLLDSVPSR